MNQNPYQDIAKEFMDVWQKQITSTIGDKQFIQATLEMFQNMQNNVQKQSHANQSSTTTSHSSPTPDPRDDLLSQLAFRLAMCEKRLAAIEGKKPAKPRETVTRKPAKRS